MQGLDPVLDGILAKMEEVTDNTNLKMLQNDQRQLTMAGAPVITTYSSPVVSSVITESVPAVHTTTHTTVSSNDKAAQI